MHNLFMCGPCGCFPKEEKGANIPSLGDDLLGKIGIRDKTYNGEQGFYQIANLFPRDGRTMISTYPVPEPEDYNNIPEVVELHLHINDKRATKSQLNNLAQSQPKLTDSQLTKIAEQADKAFNESKGQTIPYKDIKNYPDLHIKEFLTPKIWRTPENIAKLSP